MSLKNLKEANEAGKVCFGLKQTLKNSKGKKKMNIFVVSDAREETLNKLKEKKIEFSSLKKKSDVAKELGLAFECEVFLIK